MKKIIIIGCGLAGLSAAKKFSNYKNKLTVTVIDKKQTFDFLPLLPDILGKKINPKYVSYARLAANNILYQIAFQTNHSNKQ